MAGEFADVGDYDGFFAVYGGPADAGVFFEFLAGERALVWAYGQFAVGEAVKSRPEEGLELVVEDGGDGRHGGDGIGCFGQQFG